jgi:hypothetical protein
MSARADDASNTASDEPRRDPKRGFRKRLLPYRKAADSAPDRPIYDEPPFDRDEHIPF